MYRILVPIDGSEAALRALAHAVCLAKLIGKAEIHLLNVQPSIPSSVETFVGSAALANFHGDESAKELAQACDLLEHESLPVRSAMRVGSAGEAIAGHARELSCDEIVMGTRGLGRIGNLVLGSVASRVIHLADVPVTLIK